MDYERQILTYPLNERQIKEELQFFCDYLQENNYLSCEVLFGFAWGTEFYGNQDWDYISIPTKNLIEQVSQLKQKGMGSLGRDDLCVRVAELPYEFQFCHESDIHISFNRSGAFIEFFYERWKILGYSPAEWENSEGGKSSIRLRVN